MALISCPDCSKLISEDVTSCPKCGCPGSKIKEHLNKQKAKREEFQKKIAVSPKTTIIVFGVFIAAILGYYIISTKHLGRPASNLNTYEEITVLDDFQSSDFFQKYQCKETQSWPLKEGGTNHSYQTTLGDSIAFEVSTEGDSIKSLGLTFYDNDALTKNNFEVIETLLRSINKIDGDDATLSFIRQYIDRNFSQIYEAPSIKYGSFQIWAGKVLQETISIKRIK